MTPHPTAEALHGAVDAVIKRQQGRLFGQLRDKGKLDKETSASICRSFGWTGRDIHDAIDGEFPEASRVQIPQH